MGARRREDSRVLSRRPSSAGIPVLLQVAQRRTSASVCDPQNARGRADARLDKEEVIARRVIPSFVGARRKRHGEDGGAEVIDDQRKPSGGAAAQRDLPIRVCR
jgi:hypothetical protein